MLNQPINQIIVLDRSPHGSVNLKIFSPDLNNQDNNFNAQEHKSEAKIHLFRLSDWIGDGPALFLWGSLWFIPLLFIAIFLWRRRRN